MICYEFAVLVKRVWLSTQGIVLSKKWKSKTSYAIMRKWKMPMRTKITVWKWEMLNSNDWNDIRLLYGKVYENTHNSLTKPEIEHLPLQRNDGWMKVQIWEFSNQPTKWSYWAGHFRIPQMGLSHKESSSDFGPIWHFIITS